ncbi:hypothetical protein HanXRQr2_Chr17g0816111 [Helianthus annuus]|uniref:Uncharacterized protein n=1 Tax=Helianthus annuus TaxID=4232 RepID=A0A9K3DL31_HELAN|nr:hypothetical protein HanXRQr2_Chr17g0816111 [Helianthus annuus]KAJ0814292.1 hypothetical protein HanPSC8_Chr17g0783891 [Helianthus annuus]
MIFNVSSSQQRSNVRANSQICPAIRRSDTKVCGSRHCHVSSQKWSHSRVTERSRSQACTKIKKAQGFKETRSNYT